ncbi:MAG: hypothetical protein ACRDHX_09450 [Chloroflexota bacterium]
MSSTPTHIRARCVGGPRNGDLMLLLATKDDPDGVKSLQYHEGTIFTERYHLVDQETTAGERILVYVGEPPAG